MAHDDDRDDDRLPDVEDADLEGVEADESEAAEVVALPPPADSSPE